MTTHDDFDRVAPPPPDLAAEAMRAQLAATMFGAEASRLKVDRYVLIEVLGVGGMGVVHSAWDERLGRHVALKLLPAEGVGSERERARLVREAHALAKLSHPNVVHVYEVGEDGDVVFVAMELVDGLSLRQWQRERKRSVAETLDAYLQAGRGLWAAHHAGLVHRDFKPANVLVGADGRVRVADFGLAHGPGLSPGSSLRTGSPAVSLTPPSVTRTGAVAGTPAYMAPEQLAGSESDARADQFSFCVCLFEALVGRRPYDSAGLRAVLEHARAPVIARGQRRVPWAVRRALKRGLSIDPVLRWPDMDTLLQAIESRLAWRRRAATWGAPLTLGVVAAATLRQPEPDAEPPAATCVEPALDVLQAWTPEHRKGIENALRATAKPYWVGVHRGLDAALDAHARRWEQLARHSAMSCREGQLAQVRYEQTVACLEHGARRFSAVVDILQTAGSDVVEDPMGMLERLEPVASCEQPAGTMKPASDVPLELSDRLERARILAEAGRGEEALRDIQDLQHEHGPEMLTLWSEAQATRGAVLANLERYDEASDALGAAAAKAMVREQSAIAIAALRAGVEVALDLEDRSLARERTRLYETILDTLDARPSQEADFLDTRGRMRHEHGQLDAAAEDYERSLELRRVQHSGRTRYANTLLLAANVAAEQGLLERSDALYGEALELRRSMLGPEHPEVAVVLFNLGLNALSRGEFDAAEGLLARAYNIERAAFGPRSTRLARTTVKLSEVRAVLGHTQPALDLAAEAWEATRLLSPGHSDRRAALRNLAEQQRNAGNLDQALARMLDLIEEHVTHGADTPPSPELPQNIAWLLCELQACQGAAFWNRIALSQLEQFLGQSAIRSDDGLRDHFMLLQLYALNTQGTIELSRERPRAALKVLEQVLGRAPAFATEQPEAVDELVAEAEETAAKARRRL